MKLKLYCKDCNGTVWVQRDMQYPAYFEYECINCGRSKMRRWNSDKLTRYINELWFRDENLQFFYYDRPHINRRTLLAKKGKRWAIVGEEDFSYERQAVSP